MATAKQTSNGTNLPASMLALSPPAGGRDEALLRVVLAIKGQNWPAAHELPKLLHGLAAGFPIALTPGMAHVGLIAVLDAIEAAWPLPSLYPNGNRGMPLALAWWSAAAAESKADAALSHLDLVNRQLADGRPFLQGAAPGLADAHAYAGIAVALGTTAPAALDPLPACRTWFARLTALASQIKIQSAAAPHIATTAATASDVIVLTLTDGQVLTGRLLARAPGYVDLAVREPAGGFLSLRIDRVALAADE